MQIRQIYNYFPPASFIHIESRVNIFPYLRVYSLKFAFMSPYFNLDFNRNI